MKKLYISGKITGLKIEQAKANFADAEKFVKENMVGYSPVNPFDLVEQSDDKTWIDYMRADIKILVDCDAILMLPDWKDSEGAKLELQIAQGLKMKVYYI